jgi:RNA polymerase sigma-70 factor (ECF subfamily)
MVQEAFIHVFHSIRTFDETRPFEPWFLRSVVNASVRVMQRSTWQIQVGDDADESQFAELISRVESVEEQIESIQVQNTIWEAMQQLSPRQRAVIVQRYYLEMSEKEMALKSGTVTGTVKWLLHEARERLRYLLAERSDR